jgi:hypothetical protein
MVSEADDNKLLVLIFAILNTDPVFGMTAEIVCKLMCAFLNTGT